jgi:signal peptidase I
VDLAMNVVLAVLMTLFVAIDAARRRRNWAGWSILTLATGGLGVIAWLLARRRTPSTEPLGFVRTIGLVFSAIFLGLLTLVVMIFTVTFLFQVARVEGGGMAPTLVSGDRVIVNKLVYRMGEPHVGDVVMLYYPLNPERSFVKRVIAEEGDQVRIVDGQVYRNDVPMDDGFVPVEYRSRERWGPQVVPEGYYFVMGDHRNNSSDSRHWGFVPKKYIIGKVRWRWWPPRTMRLF